MGERFRTPKDTRALEAYRKAVDSFHQFVTLSGGKIEFVDVPFEGKKLPGYFVPALNVKSVRTPCRDLSTNRSMLPPPPVSGSSESVKSTADFRRQCRNRRGKNNNGRLFCASSLEFQNLTETAALPG